MEVIVALLDWPAGPQAKELLGSNGNLRLFSGKEVINGTRTTTIPFLLSLHDLPQ